MDKPYKELEERIEKLEIEIFAINRSLRRMQDKNNELERKLDRNFPNAGFVERWN